MIIFALERFSIRSVQDLRELYKYEYSKMKEVYEYGYSRVEKLYEYGYFGTEEPHEDRYPILKNLDRNIQDRHGFQILVIADK